MDNMMDENAKRIEELERLIFKGDDITLPIAVISNLVEQIREDSKKHKEQIDKLVKEKHQIWYMFLSIMITFIGKSLIYYYLGIPQ